MQASSKVSSGNTRRARELGLALAAPPDDSLNLAGLYLAPVETDHHHAAGYRFPHARGFVAQHEGLAVVKADDLAEMEIIHELHAGRVAAYALDYSDLRRIRRGNRGKCSYSRENNGCKLALARCPGQDARELTGIARHDRSSSFRPYRLGKLGAVGVSKV